MSDCHRMSENLECRTGLNPGTRGMAAWTIVLLVAFPSRHAR
jgi:hypothetical protein